MSGSEVFGARIGGTLISLPFAGGLYSYAMRSVTAETGSRFTANPSYRFHDIGIIGVALAAGIGLGLTVR
jgi:hypothetical protein